MGRYSFLANALKVFDVVTMVVVFTTSAILASPELDNATVGQFFAVRIKLGNFVLFGGFVALWHILFSGFGLYRPLRLFNSYREAAGIAKATTMGTLIWVIVALLFNVSFVNTRFVLVFWLGTTTLSILGTLIIRNLLGRFNGRERNLQRFLVAGVNPRSIRVARQLQAKRQHGYRLIGFVDDAIMHNTAVSDSDIRLVANLETLPDFLRKTAVDEVLVCLPFKSQYDGIAKIVALCEEQGITVRILGDIFQAKLAHSRVDQFGSQTFITVHPHTINGIQGSTKRVLDVILSISLLVLASPIFVITAVLVKLTSPGPVLFSQERLGLNKKRFRMLKFRTMVREAEKEQAALEEFNEMTGPVFKIKNDPRITLIGKYLRKTSIDELPQLINVIKGEMSLVGPRPLAVRDYEGFNEDGHRRRFCVRPGITGLWQISGRNAIPFERWMALDLQYIDEWSLLLDLKVMLKTVPAVLRGSGAE